MTPIIHTLPSIAASTQVSDSSLRDGIESGLLGTAEPTVPGSRPEDRQWAFKRSVPTVVLYDEQGLRLYDKITSDAAEYYLFPDELILLKTHGEDIARSMGFPGRVNNDREDDPEKDGHEGKNAPSKPWKPARWGDADVGKWNNGVNGEEGLGGGFEPGWDVVELGAGALRKTGHLLSALASSVPDCSSPLITYHPLDLSYPELDRVLAEMDKAFGEQLNKKVDCIGLHGDYEAGLQFIRQGKLPSLRQQRRQPASPRGRVPQIDDISIDRDASPSPDSIHLVIPAMVAKPLDLVDQSPPLTASDDVVTPGPGASPLPSAVTDMSSEVSQCGDNGTWSPVETDEIVVDAHDSTHTTCPPHTLASPPHKHTTSPTSDRPSRPLHLIFLGSSLGNFERASAAPFLKSLPLRFGDTLLLGLDGRPAPGAEGRQKVQLAYNDPAGHTRAFEEHGWDVVRKELGLQGDAGVEFVGRYNEVLGRHEAYYRSKDQQRIDFHSNQNVTLEKDELLNIEWSYKYSYTEALDLFKQADLRIINCWKAPDSEYRLWLLERPPVQFIHNSTDMESKDTHQFAALDAVKGIPKWEEWRDLWKLWDHITLDMIPEEMLHQKPIDLRHICLFYLGHIPTFLDIHLTRMTKGSHTEPEHFKDIFERGIDPDVDDPSKIHSHSEVPTSQADWPSLHEILAFRDRVRLRLHGIYDQIASGDMAFTRYVGRVLFMTFEHEAMHAETLLYMLIQSPSTRPPAVVAQPRWDVLAKRWEEEAVSNKVLSLSGGTIELGHHDVEGEDEMFPDQHGWAGHEFGWDNEHPKVAVTVKPFRVDSLPVSNTDYLDYLHSINANFDDHEAIPASWVKVGTEWKIRSLYGPLGFDVAGRWPLMASKNEIDGYAKSKGGRMPTEGELRLLWSSPEGPKPAGALANVGVKNWHPIPPTNTHTDNAGSVLHGHNGGVWEWTNTEFNGYEGYVPSKIYPGYSSDFFDGKHYVVIGGSYETIPSIAARPSFRNWYQASYRFAFIGGRVAYNV